MLKIQFVSKNPHHTASLEITGPVDEFEQAEKPGGVIDQLCNLVRWKPQTGRPTPDFGGQRNRYYTQEGSGFFGAWTAGEQKTIMSATRRFLKTKGYAKVGWHKKTLEEML